MESGLKSKLKNPIVNNMESSSSVKLKRTRASSNGYQVVPSCLVDGCKSDLSKCRDYHRRHKVCELHSKTPKVTIKGQEQRFCQQCSRFHSLVEFDEGKRSCRKRLDGHNRRRRKPQPEPTSINHARFFSNFQGTRFLPFHSPQLFTTAGMSSALAGSDGILKAEIDIPNNSSAPICQSHNGEKRFGLLEDFNRMFPDPSDCQQHFGTTSTLDNCGNTHKVFSSWLYRENESDCALSLLSPTPLDSKEVGFSNIMQSNPVASTQSLIAGDLHFSALVSSRSNANLLSQEMFQIRPYGSSVGDHIMFSSPL